MGGGRTSSSVRVLARTSAWTKRVVQILARESLELLSADVSVLNMRKTLRTLHEQLHSQSVAPLRDKRIIIRRGIPYLSEDRRIIFAYTFVPTLHPFFLKLLIKQ